MHAIVQKVTNMPSGQCLTRTIIETLKIGQDCLKLHFVRLRVPEECPLAIANLYTACTMAEAKDRPSASAIVRSLEDAVPSATGAEEP